jgi:hypothetical protein
LEAEKLRVEKAERSVSEGRVEKGEVAGIGSRGVMTRKSFVDVGIAIVFSWRDSSGVREGVFLKI